MNELAEIHRSIGELDGKLSFLVAAEKSRSAVIDNHDLRIRKLEVRWSKLTGFLLIIPALTTGLWKWFTRGNSHE